MHFFTGIYPYPYPYHSSNLFIFLSHFVESNIYSNVARAIDFPLNHTVGRNTQTHAHTLSACGSLDNDEGEFKENILIIIIKNCAFSQF